MTPVRALAIFIAVVEATWLVVVAAGVVYVVLRSAGIIEGIF
jgi:hypothetical protein